MISTGDVAGEIGKWLQTTHVIPAFSFIDPFGYKGLSLGLVQGAIKDWGCDCVFFFNYNRINAGISNPLVEMHMNELFGKERADKLRTRLRDLNPIEREACVLESLAQAIRSLGGRYVLPFRFRSQTGTRTTHHLVFVSKHVLGYEIMKGIMASESSTHDQGVPSFEYSPADEKTPLLFSLNQPLKSLGKQLLTKFSGEILSMIQIYDRHQVDTPFIKKNYKDVLLELEAEGKIKADPTERRKGTFADTVSVTFPKQPKKAS